MNNKTYVKFQLNNARMFHESDLKLAYFVKGPAGKKFRAIDRREESTSGYHSAGLSGFTEGQDNGAFNAHTCSEEVIGIASFSDVSANLRPHSFSQAASMFRMAFSPLPLGTP